MRIPQSVSPAMAAARAPSVAVVIVNYRTAALTIECVKSLAAERANVGPFDVIIADGKSPDDSVATLTAFFAAPEWRDWVQVLPLPVNGGFGWANNQAMLRLLQRPEPPDFIYLINPDCVAEPGAIRALLDVILAHPEVGAVGSQLFEPDGRSAGSAFRFPSIGRELVSGLCLHRIGALLGVQSVLVERTDPGPAEWITGASVLFRSAALRRTGLFDDGFFLYFEEVELMRRMTRAGWALWTVPESRVMHIGGAATGVESGARISLRPHPPYRFESRRRYYVRVGGLGTLLLANLAWLGGRIFGMPLRLFRHEPFPIIPRELAMTARYSLWPRARDFRPSYPQWDEPPGRPPAWSVE
jgi:N-acetylglucosaminyl-diphospho-decaprenol L-rhamnosyltransferase